MSATVLGDIENTVAGEAEKGITLTKRVAFSPPDYFDEKSAGMDSLIVDTRTAQRNWFLFATLQTLLLALIIGLVVYKSYSASFVGNWDELTTIFLMAFSADVTVDTIAQLKDKKS